ncbi:MAG: hypothetical protein KBD43_12035, partial [Saprospiraceae bacterium]|nr:hypothetical protein [Saprospiraceae bacterium]
KNHTFCLSDICVAKLNADKGKPYPYAHTIILSTIIRSSYSVFSKINCDDRSRPIPTVDL